MTYLWWTIDSALIGLSRWLQPIVEQLCARREPRLYTDWDLELAEAEAEREKGARRTTVAARISGSSTG